jgi:hypothetical protein
MGNTRHLAKYPAGAGGLNQTLTSQYGFHSLKANRILLRFQIVSPSRLYSALKVPELLYQETGRPTDSSTYSDAAHCY